MHNDQKPLQKFLNGKNGNNKVNWWSLDHIQHHIWIDIGCTRQGRRLSIPISWSFQQSSKCQHPHQHGHCIHTRWTCHLHPQQSKSINGHYALCWCSNPITTGHHQSKHTPPVMEGHKRVILQMQKTRSILQMYLQMVVQWQSTSP